MTSDTPSLDQRRARHAWSAVEKAKATGNINEYAREAKQLPVRIKTAGVGQALAFLNAKSSEKAQDPKRFLLLDLGGWLFDERELCPRPDGSVEPGAILKAIILGDQNLLRRVTAEALDYLQWLTRLSEAESTADGQ
jgi:CRISPR-associated protein Cmr5